VFTYYLPEFPQTAKQTREKQEEALRAQGEDIPFPGWEKLREESNEASPRVLLLVKDEAGNPIRWISGASKKGLQRVNWDLRLPPPDPIKLTQPAFKPPWASDPQGPLAAAGNYSVTLFIEQEGKMIAQSDPQTFTVKPVPNGVDGTDLKAVAAFQQRTRELDRQVAGAGQKAIRSGRAPRLHRRRPAPYAAGRA
jgi:hypothetical protein